IYLHELLLQEWLAVFHADHFAVMAGKEGHFVFEGGYGEEDLMFLVVLGGLAFFGAKLGSESENGFAALLVLRGDVHDEGGAHVGVGDGIKNFEGAEGFAFEGELLESRKETAFIAESRGVVVVGVASFPVGKDDGFRAE